MDDLTPQGNGGGQGPTEAERLQKLNAVLDAALSQQAVEPLLETLLPRVRDALDADTCAVLLLDSETGELVTRAGSGLEQGASVRVPLGHGFAGTIAATKGLLFVPDVGQVDLANPALRAHGLQALLGAPLIGENGVIGVIHVGWLTPHDLRDEERDLLQLVAGRVSIAVEHAIVHERLVQVDRLRRMFIGIASHELRGPATAIAGIGATLHQRREQLRPEQVSERYQTLAEQAARLTALIDSLLDLSRLDAQAAKINPRPIDLRTNLEAIVDRLPNAAGAVRVDSPDDLVIDADTEALEHVVGNLISNALRYGKPPIVVQAAAGDHHVRIAVEDHGSGVPADFVPLLFDRFTRAEQTAETSGSGLGLAIARAYAQAHGGELYYEPADPTGARFVLVLPRMSNLS